MRLGSPVQHAAKSATQKLSKGFAQYAHALTTKKHWVRAMAYFTPMHCVSTLVERGLMGLEADEMTQLRLITAAGLALGTDAAIEWFGNAGKELYDKNGQLENSTHGEDVMNALKFSALTVGTSTALYHYVTALPMDQALAGGMFMGACSLPRGFFLEKSKKLFYGLHLGLDETYDWIKEFSGAQRYKAKMFTYGSLLALTTAAYTLPAHEWTWLSEQLETGQEKLENNLEEKIKKEGFTP